MQEPQHKYVTLFASFVVSIDSAIADDAEKGRLYTAIAHYSLYGKEPELTGVSAALFELMRPNIDTSNKRRIAGEKGGKKSKVKAKTKQNESKSEANSKQSPPMEKEKEIGDGYGNGESINTFTDEEKNKIQETCDVVKKEHPRCNYPILADRAVCAAVKRISKDKGIDILKACEYLQERVKLYAKYKYGDERQYLPEANNWLDNGGYDANETSWSKGTGNETIYIPKHG